MLVCLGGIGLLFMGMWGKSDAMSRYIRTAWVLFAAIGFWFISAMCGIWCWWISSRDPYPGSDVMPYTAYFKAEFAFEIIGSILMIVSVTLFAAFGAGEEPSDA